MTFSSIKKKLNVIILICIVLYLFSVIDFLDFLSVLNELNPLFALPAFLFIFLQIIISGINVWMILTHDIKLKLYLFLKHYFTSLALSFITPAQLGDVSISYFLVKENIPVSKTLAAYTVDKFSMFLIYLSVTAIGILLFIPQAAIYSFVIGVSGIAILFILFFLFKKGIKIPRFTGFIEKIIIQVSKLINDIKSIPLKYIAFNFMGNIIKFLLLSFAYFAGFKSFGQYVQWPDIGILPIMSGLVAYLPISIGGIGTVEFTAIELFNKIGISSSIVLSVYFFLRMSNYIIMLILLGITRIFYLKKSESQNHGDSLIYIWWLYIIPVLLDYNIQFIQLL
jgi:uncharacterized protein (TIRG00374 family)